METEQATTLATPPPPPPPRETEELLETLVKVEDLDEVVEDIKLPTVNDVATSLSPSELKRKREEVNEDGVKGEEFTEKVAKKVKGAETINGIHKSKDLEMADETGMGLNGGHDQNGFLMEDEGYGAK